MGSIFEMGLSYEQALAALYQAPLEAFVSERKRLAGELKAGGDKAGAARIAKLARPSVSAWAVNQLWWHAREAFDELFESAAELRRGNLAANTAHRKALARLGARAQELLSQGGNSANDGTLRKVAMTLSGLAAVGSFAPDTPGALGKDRDPPGFDALGFASSSDEQGDQEGAPAEPERRAAVDNERQREVGAAQRKREAEVAEAERERAAAVERERAAAVERERAAAVERQRKAEDEAARQARREQLERELADAKAELLERERESERLEKQLAAARHEVERARSLVEAAQAALAG